MTGESLTKGEMGWMGSSMVGMAGAQAVMARPVEDGGNVGSRGAHLCVLPWVDW